jgi:hypothetical protein
VCEFRLEFLSYIYIKLLYQESWNIPITSILYPVWIDNRVVLELAEELDLNNLCIFNYFSFNSSNGFLLLSCFLFVLVAFRNTYPFIPIRSSLWDLLFRFGNYYSGGAKPPTKTKMDKTTQENRHLFELKEKYKRCGFQLAQMVKSLVVEQGT